VNATPDEVDGPRTFYPGNRWIWCFIGLVVTFSVFILFGGVVSNSGWVAALLAALLCLAAYPLFFAWRQVIRPRPVLRLEHDGFECAWGRLVWSDVAGIHLVRGETFQGAPYERLEFTLRSGARPLASSHRYFPKWWGLRREVPSRTLRARLSGQARQKGDSLQVFAFGVGSSKKSKRTLATARRLKAEYGESQASSSWGRSARAGG